jgi:hypothetical protein
MPVIRHQAPVENADGHAAVRQQEHTLEGQNVVILPEQPKPAVSAVENVIDQSAGRGSSDGGGMEKDQPEPSAL